MSVRGCGCIKRHEYGVSNIILPKQNDLDNAARTRLDEARRGLTSRLPPQSGINGGCASTNALFAVLPRP